MLNIKNLSQFIKLGPENHPLSEKGGGIIFLVLNELCPSEISIPCLAHFGDIMWMCVRHKVLPSFQFNCPVLFLLLP